MFFPFYRYTDRPAKSPKAYNSVSTLQRICLPITPSPFLEISEGRYSSHFLLSYMTFASILLFGDTYKLALSCLLFAFWQICGFLTYIYLSRLVALICRATKSSTRSMPKSKIPVHFIPGPPPSPPLRGARYSPQRLQIRSTHFSYPRSLLFRHRE
jgi:hypothetical protein